MPDLMRVLTGLFLCWIFASKATAQTPLPAHPTPAPPLSHRLLYDVQHEIATVEPLLDHYGYGAVFVAVGVEGFGIPAPGQTLLIAGAVTAANQNQLRIDWLLFAAFMAALLGNSAGYLIGRRGGRALLRRFRISERHLQRIEHGFTRYGGGLLIIARFFDGLRQLNGIAAGLLEMPWWRFTFYNALGAMLWVSCWGLGIYTLDENLHTILAAIHALNPWVTTITLASVISLILLLLHYCRSQRPNQND
ncbi:MAG TPA: DedA family protein [Candidatus Competibacteraceae bacterium]|nr:DedA family protein [Candidatus Competibacteraceae bacterium]MCP5134384.1 DedA family protein [Gammaproteobacteria bacterium]HPF57835.1 DedA family protein [Candidatus Competibacteraceae bacterium]HRY17405.1 DedA family protein [Candidatus Competibacteraceae bacterium]